MNNNNNNNNYCTYLNKMSGCLIAICLHNIPAEFKHSTLEILFIA